MKQNTLAVEWVPIGKLFLSPSNPRQNDAGVPHVAASIRRFGWRQPVVARPTGEVIAGNTRLKAAKSMGLEAVPVVWFEGSDLEATAYAIADNRTAEFSEWDGPALAKLLEELRAEDALEGVGYTGQQIDELLAELGAGGPAPEVDDPGPAEPPEEPVTRRGDLWLLGDHRLLCGDSTSAEDLARLMGNEKARLLSTDPPYCVDYTGDNRPVHEGKKSGKDWSALYREVDIKDLGSFLDAFLGAALPLVREDAPIYLWHAHVQQPVVASVFERRGILFHQVLVWAKPCPVFGRSYYQWQHEPCAFGWQRGHKPKHGTAQLSSIWPADWDGRARFSTFHPTSKPTRLFEIPMEQHTARGEVVLEPFSGSGSQIIAAEKLARRCRAMELSPAFVDGTILRYQEATGKEARLEETGRSYAEVRSERNGG